MKVYLYGLVCLLFLIYSCSTQSKQEKLELSQKRYNQIKSLVESGKYKFVASQAFPLDTDAIRVISQIPGAAGVFQGNSVNLSGNENFLQMNGKEASIDLPYFGRGYTATSYGGQDIGIEFEGIISNYEVSYNDNKQTLDIKFTTERPNDNYQFQLFVTGSGNATLNVNSNTKQSIRYNGNLLALDD